MEGDIIKDISYIVHIVIGFAFIYAGYKVGIPMRKRQFERRNAAGIEVHESYSDMKKTKFKDGMISNFQALLSIVGVFLIGFGLVRLVNW